MDRKVYFGNAVKQLWIPAPKTGLNASSQAFFNDTQLLSGRAYLRRSEANHRRFAPAWNGPLNAESASDSLHTIKDYFDGLYGDGPFYWLDPFAVETNLLPPQWAAPMLSTKDWPSICSIGESALVDTDANTRDYPYKSLEVSFDDVVEESTPTVRLLIPAGYKLHFGWHGKQVSGDASVFLRAYARSNGASTDIEAEPLAVTSAIRTNKSVSGNTYSMVDIIIKNPTAATSVIEIAGMIAQVLPENDSVAQGNFISGRGTMGLHFSSAPSITYISSKLNSGLVELATNFIEE
jgi:hypothetical protein